MNLELDQDQRDLVGLTADVCSAWAAEWRSEAAPHSVDRAGLKALADLGILGVRHPEPAGSGLGPVEAVLAAQPCGAALAPTLLLIWADLVGPAIPGVPTGEVSVTGSFDPGRGFSHGGGSDVAIVVDERGAHAVDARAVEWEPLPQVDPLTLRAALPFAIPDGAVTIADPVAVQQWRWQYCLLIAAHLVGVGCGAVEASVTYAQDRHQFGRPIGSFQAIKHLLADAYTAMELARSQVLVAALYWAEEHPSAPDHATAAAVVAARAAVTAAETAIQVHGGMGFTWEAVPHLYYKRALLLQDELGGLGALVNQLAGRDLSVPGPGIDQ